MIYIEEGYHQLFIKISEPRSANPCRLYTGSAQATAGAGPGGLCLDLPTLVSEVVAESVCAVPEICALVAKCRTLIETARTKNAFRTEFDAFSLRKLKQIRDSRD